MRTVEARHTATSLALLLCGSLLAPVWAGDREHHGPPVRIRFQAPVAGDFQGLTTPTGWALVMRIEAPHSVAIVETPEEPPSGRREAIVLTDSDGCLDLSHFPITRAGTPYEKDCPYGPEETFLEFTTERIDAQDIPDSNTGNFQVRNRLVDDAYAPGVRLNKPYLLNNAGVVVAVDRPQTGEALLDGYGFGPDDDLPGLVVMSDTGAARVFEANFDLPPGPRVVRNMAGFVNTVAQELLTKRGGSALTATMFVLAGMFEPLALFDLDVDEPGVDYKRRLESGPMEAFAFAGTPRNNDDILRQISASYSPYTIEVRALLVEGVAPTFIEDANHDGRFTAADLRKMGYKVISNEARLRQVIDLDVTITETFSGRTCPPRSLIFRDLDGNTRDGAINCQGSGGAARVRGVPE